MSERPAALLCAPAPPRSTVGAAERTRVLFERHFDFIARVLRNCGVMEGDVDDLLQQTFTILAAKLDLVEAGCEKSFLVQTGLRLAADARRRYARSRERATDDLPEVSDGQPSPEELSDRRRAMALLDRLLVEMELDLRSVFVLYEIEELTVPEIAALLAIPAGTAASRLRRAREDFQARLRRSGFTRGARP